MGEKGLPGRRYTEAFRGRRQDWQIRWGTMRRHAVWACR